MQFCVCFLKMFRPLKGQLDKYEIFIIKMTLRAIVTTSRET